jgi:hypothetical protein
MFDTMLHENNHAAGRGKPYVVAYADDVTVILHSPNDIPNVREALSCYEAATGARLNTRKSKMMGLGTWNSRIDILDISYCDELRILGMQMTTSTNQSANKSWALIARTIRAQAHEAYYICMICDTTRLSTLRMAITLYVWRGDIFRVSLSTLCSKRETGAWNLTHVEAKYRTLLIIQGRIAGKITNWWLKRWKLQHPSANPPHLNRISRLFEYLRILAVDTAHIPPQGQEETIRTYRRRTYEVLRQLLRGETPMARMCKKTLWPGTYWGRVWGNL